MYYTESDGNSYPAKKRIRAIDRSKVTTWSREIVNCNILEVEAGTNGYQGGDSGHGGRTYFRIEDQGSTDIQVLPIGRYGDEGFEVFLCVKPKGTVSGFGEIQVGVAAQLLPDFGRNHESAFLIDGVSVLTCHFLPLYPLFWLVFGKTYH